MTPLPRLLAHWLDCRHATRMISQLQDRRLTAWESARLRWHLAACEACARFERQTDFLRQAMRRLRT
jgi:hypothetical protein